jgi:hypothetical protein
MENSNNLSLAIKSVFTGGAILTYTKKNSFLLFILPLVYGIFAWFFYYQGVNFFTTYVDSTYIYLVNGLNIASGHFDLGHYDNPGTTAHWLAGIVFYITHLLVGNGNIVEDVLNRPEFYLRVAAIVCIVLIVLSTYFAGLLIAKKTGNYITAFFFQLIVVSSYLNVIYMIRASPEYIIIVTLPYYCAFLWMLSYKKSEVPGFTISIKSVLFLAFVTAALVVAKITCVPFLLVPFFFIDKLKKIILYIISTVVFGLLILYPVWNNFGNMYKWFFGMATHSGIYGSGKEQIIDKAEYIKSLKLIFTNEWFFTIGFILVSVLVVAGLFTKKWKNSFYKLTLAFWLVIVLQILLAAKHYSAHYLIAAQAVTIPAVLAGFVALPQFKLNKMAVALMLVLSTGFLLYKLQNYATAFIDGNKQYISSVGAAKQFGNMPKIYTTGYTESCFVESALSFGTAYGGDGFEEGRQYLRKRYPTSFLYERIPNKLYCFLKEVPSSTIFENYPEVLVNFLRQDEASEKSALAGITEEYKFAVKNIEHARANPETGENFYVIHTDTALAKRHYTQIVTVNFDFEKNTVDKSNFLSAAGLDTCGGADASSKEQFTSATTSLKASPKNQYVGWTTFDMKPGEGLEITVNRRTEDEVGGISLSMANDKSFEKASEDVVADLGNGWKKIRLKTRIPNNSPGGKVGLCFFYFGTKTCYFDDLCIKILKE